MQGDLASYLSALCVGGVLGWILRGSLGNLNKSVRDKVRSKI